MRNLRLVLAAMLLFSLVPFSLRADPIITEFKCGNLTHEGKIYVSNTTTSNAGFIVKVSRALSGGGYENVNLLIEFVYRVTGMSDESLGTYNIVTADFGVLEVVQKSYIISIPAGRIGGHVSIKFSYTSSTGNFVNSYTTESYQTSNVPNVGVSAEGSFVRDGSTDKVYYYIGGIWRHVQTLATLQGCWDKDKVWKSRGLIATNAAAPSPIGDPITPNTSILNHTVTGKVYFQDGNTLRWITSISVRDHYKFSFANLRHTNSIVGYIIGPDL